MTETVRGKTKAGRDAALVVANELDQVACGEHRLPRVMVVVAPLTKSAPWVSARVKFEIVDGKPGCREFAVVAETGARDVLAKDAHVPGLIDDLLDFAITAAVQIRDDVFGVPVGRASWQRNAVASKEILRTRRVVNDDVLRDVARVYAENLAGAPVKAVEQAMKCSSRTASLWVKRAYDAGFITELARGSRATSPRKEK